VRRAFEQQHVESRRMDDDEDRDRTLVAHLRRIDLMRPMSIVFLFHPMDRLAHWAYSGVIDQHIDALMPINHRPHQAFPVGLFRSIRLHVAVILDVSS
jgi:hypothetical protein